MNPNTHPSFLSTISAGSQNYKPPFRPAYNPYGSAPSPYCGSYQEVEHTPRRPQHRYTHSDPFPVAENLQLPSASTSSHSHLHPTSPDRQQNISQRSHSPAPRPPFTAVRPTPPPLYNPIMQSPPPALSSYPFAPSAQSPQSASAPPISPYSASAPSPFSSGSSGTSSSLPNDDADAQPNASSLMDNYQQSTANPSAYYPSSSTANQPSSTQGAYMTSYEMFGYPGNTNVNALEDLYSSNQAGVFGTVGHTWSPPLPKQGQQPQQPQMHYSYEQLQQQYNDLNSQQRQPLPAQSQSPPVQPAPRARNQSYPSTAIVDYSGAGYAIPKSRHMSMSQIELQSQIYGQGIRQNETARGLRILTDGQGMYNLDGTINAIPQQPHHQQLSTEDPHPNVQGSSLFDLTAPMSTLQQHRFQAQEYHVPNRNARSPASVSPHPPLSSSAPTTSTYVHRIMNPYYAYDSPSRDRDGNDQEQHLLYPASAAFEGSASETENGSLSSKSMSPIEFLPGVVGQRTEIQKQDYLREQEKERERERIRAQASAGMGFDPRKEAMSHGEDGDEDDAEGEDDLGEGEDPNDNDTDFDLGPEDGYDDGTGEYREKRHGRRGGDEGGGLTLRSRTVNGNAGNRYNPYPYPGGSAHMSGQTENDRSQRTPSFGSSSSSSSLPVSHMYTLTSSMANYSSEHNNNDYYDRNSTSPTDSPGRRRSRARPASHLPIPIPVPNLTKKSRGRRVPTVANTLEGNGKRTMRGGAGGSGKGTRMYMCDVDGCGKCFARGEHLKRHVRSIHTHEKPHRCPHPGCGKDFSRHDNLSQHLRVHKPDGHSSRTLAPKHKDDDAYRL